MTREMLAGLALIALVLIASAVLLVHDRIPGLARSTGLPLPSGLRGVPAQGTSGVIAPWHNIPGWTPYSDGGAGVAWDGTLA